MASLQDGKSEQPDQADTANEPDVGQGPHAQRTASAAPQSTLNQSGNGGGSLPQWPQASTDGDLTTGATAMLRRFHLDDPSAAEQTSKVGDGLLPALLYPYRDVSSIRYQYPLYLHPPQSDRARALAEPVTEFLRASVEAFAVGAEGARILKDNLPWIEQYLRQELGDGVPVDAATLFSRAADALHAHLGLTESNRERLEADLENLKAVLGENGQFLGYGPDVAIHLLVHAVRSRGFEKRQAFRRKVDKLIAGLTTLLEVERAKAPTGEPGAVQSSVGSGASYIDTEALSGLIGQRRQGSVIMPAERRRRIEGALAVLQGLEDESVLVTFVVASKDPSIERSPMVEVIDDADPCRAAAAVHDREAKRVAPVFAAARIAGLEIEDRYDPAVHDSWFAGFDWHAFSEAEMQLVTKVVALESAGRVARDGLPSFSSLLGSRKPVHILISVNAVDNPGATPDEDPFRSFRFELGYFGIGHRQVLVAQTSAARYEDTLSGFVSALDGTRTSLHLVNRGNRTQTSQPRLDPWIVASAALESRAHPFVLVNPDAGDHAAERVRFNSNPQPERDWSIETLQFRDAQGEVAEMQMAFTFADYCLLMPELHEYFRIVPIGCESEDLVPVGDYLNLAEDRLDRCVPFVWAVDVDGMLHRVVVSRILTLACRDRQNYWHSLQELAGIRNIYVEQAKEQVRQEEQLAFASECERLQESFTEELERVRAEAAGAVMGQLVDVLMGGDFAGLLESGGRSAGETASSADLRSEPPSETEPAPTEPESEPGAEEEEESVSFDDPWIDSMMCTTCDDCMGINKVVFVYNENKQAIIADPSAGTYADMVQAAEICPAKCIHPGKPLDPNEPGLDELVARAEPFN